MNEEALLARASEERERIFQRYERGRENLVGQIDPWEDPEFEEYHKTDRYDTYYMSCEFAYCLMI